MDDTENTWKEIFLGDVLQFQRGFDITKKEQVPDEIPIVSSSGITSYHNQWKIKCPGVVIGRKGTLGATHYIDRNFWPHDTTLWIKNFKGNNPRFLYYFLQTMHFENFDTGSSNPTLNRNHLHKIKTLFPNLFLQKKIAAILSTYDDLIGNNKRRIALLEKMAEEIYREWFVRMRFPGHEKVKFKKGLPENWTHIKISDIAYLNYGYTESAIYELSLPKFLRVKDINKNSYIIWSTVPNCRIEDGDYFKYKLKRNDIVIAMMADPGKVAIIEENLNAVFASYLIKINYDPGLALPYYLYYTLRSDFYADYFSNANSGATRGSINGGLIGGTSILLPPYELMHQFNSEVSLLRDNIRVLCKLNERLERTMDSLLCRLISGKLSVETLDIQFPHSMQNEQDVDHAKLHL